MKFKAKLALFSLAAGAIALSGGGGCWMKWLGDTLADILWFSEID